MHDVYCCGYVECTPLIRKLATLGSPVLLLPRPLAPVARSSSGAAGVVRSEPELMNRTLRRFPPRASPASSGGWAAASGSGPAATLLEDALTGAA